VNEVNGESNMTAAFEERMLQVHGIKIHVILAGPLDGPPVILLHGFPDFWGGWHKQIDAFTSAGYRLILPDQRGYNLSEKPKGVTPYRLDLLAGDVVGLMAALGYSSFSVVGHDWGGVVAWAVAAIYPDCVRRLAILDAPYPGVVLPSSFRHPRQFLRSSYILFFQIPWLPEALFRRNQWALLANSIRKTAPPGVFTAETLDRYRETWNENGAMTAMLNWYRALVRKPVKLPINPDLPMPVLILWGGLDFALGKELAVASQQVCKRVKLVIFEQANHWIQLEVADEVNQALLAFFGQQNFDPGNP
jgi:epoxide hydrolase 4